MKARLTKQVREYAEAIGCSIVKAKTFDEGKHRLIGIHLLRPTQRELEGALATAERDGFRTIVIHSFDSWAPGAMHRRPKLRLIQGGAA